MAVAPAHGGTVLNWGATEAGVEKLPDGSCRLTALFPMAADEVFLGTWSGSAFHTGSGKDQLGIREIVLETTSFDAPDHEDALRMVDVGAAQGLDVKWFDVLEKLDVILVEPAAAEADRLELLKYPRSRILRTALSDKSGEATLFRTRKPGCSSLRKPNRRVLDRYPIASMFDVVAEETVRCVRYDELYALGEVFSPEYIKVDAQGLDLEVLKGFGQLLNSCLGLEVEAQFYQIYEGQTLLHEMIAYVEPFGLYLRGLTSQPNFAGDLVEVNAVFTRQSSEWWDASSSRKLRLIESKCNLARPEASISVALQG